MVINLIGLCASGKTTLATKLSRYYHLPILTIGKYRNMIYKRYKNKTGDNWSRKNENNAWLKMFDDASRMNWNNYIICTSGMNGHLDFLLNASLLPITIKLVCSKKKLNCRLAKRKHRQKWFFDTTYEEFNHAFADKMAKTKANLTINTGIKDKHETFMLARKEIEKYKGIENVEE